VDKEKLVRAGVRQRGIEMMRKLQESSESFKVKEGSTADRVGVIGSSVKLKEEGNLQTAVLL